MSKDIVERVFEEFKEEYGVSETDPQSLLQGQRDILEFLMRLGRRLEQLYFDELGSGYAGTKAVVAGVEYVFKGYRIKSVHGLFGKVKLKRAYYVAQGAGKTYYPLDEELKVGGHTPGLQYYLSQLTGGNAYQMALDLFAQIFRPYGEDEISMRKALDMDYELGAALEGLRQQEIEATDRGESIERHRPIDGVVAVSIDATKIREKLGEEKGKDGKRSHQIGWRDAKVAAVSAVQWDRAADEAKCVDSSYVNGEEHADLFFKRIWVEMQRRCADVESAPFVFIADGANWIWDRVGDLANKGSVQILDFYHACNHLSQLCKQLYGEQTPEFWQHYKLWKKMFAEGKAGRVVGVLKTMAKKTRSSKTMKALLDQIAYFEPNLARMAYARFREMKLPIGSGTIESACKNVIGGRMKQGGMTWSPAGADGMLQIRASQASGRFESDFQCLLAA